MQVKCKNRKVGIYFSWAVLVLGFLGGAIALGHQLLWTRRMVDLLGAGVESHARVIGMFFLGLALGSALGGWLSRRVWRPWRILGLVELAIIIAATPMLTAPGLAGPLWAWLGPEATAGWVGGIILLLLPFLLVFPAAALMGFFVPMAIVGSGRSQTRFAVLLYAVNTLGAVLGILLVLGILWQRFEMGTSLLWVMGGNMLVAVGCFVLDYMSPPTSARQGEAGGIPGKQWLLLAGASGFLVLASEIVAIEMLQLLMPMAFFAPGAVLGSVILVLGMAGLVVAWLGNRLGAASLVFILLVSGLLLCAVPPLFFFVTDLFPVIREGTSLAGFLLRLGLFSTMVLGTAFFASGLVFPVVAGLGAGTASNKWGWLIAVNGLGGWLGTEAAFRLLLPMYGPHGALGILGFLYAGCACLLPTKKQAFLQGLACVGALLCLLAAAGFLPQLPRVHPKFVPYVLEQWHGRDGALAVLEGEPFGRSMLVANQYFLGSTAAGVGQERQAHIPLLLHSDPRSVGFLGVATGITPGGALAHPGVERIEAAEMSPQVLEAAQKYFNEANRGVLTDSRVHIEAADARTWLASRVGQFDVLCGDLFLPWGPGEARLFSLEHFQAAKSSLREGGVFVQWLPMYQLTNDQFMMIAGTFLEVFSPAEVILRDGSDHHPVLGLVGWKDGPEKSPGRTLAGESDPLLRDREVLTDLRLGTLSRGKIKAPVNTLNNPVVERDAARLRVLKPESAPYLRGPLWLDWLEGFSRELSAPNPAEAGSKG